MDKNTALAAEIVAGAAAALNALDREMTITKWPPEFRAIMWAVVADIATRRAKDAGGLEFERVDVDASERQ